MAIDPEKPARRMSCWNCPRYSRTDRKCREGKVNPKRKSDTFAVAELLGLRALCHYNPYRDALAMRMFHPSAGITIRHAVETRKARRVARLEADLARLTALEESQSETARTTE